MVCKIKSSDFYRKQFGENTVWSLTERDGAGCYICGRELFLEVHHKIQLQHGGDNEIDNLCLLCKECHALVHKGDINSLIRRARTNKEWC